MSEASTADPTAPAPPRTPMLSVVGGNPSPEQLAALVAVLASRGGAAPEVAPAPRRWTSGPRRALPTPGPGAWRASALPQG